MRIINVDTMVLRSSVSKMRKMSTSWSSNNILSPATKGGGKTVNELEALAAQYQEMNELMVELATQTADFLDKIRQGYEESDNKASWLFKN